MDIHENIRTLPHGRMLMVQRLAAGWPAATVATALGVTAKTVRKIHIDIKKLGRIDGIGRRITGDRTGQSSRRAVKRGLGWEIYMSPSTTGRAWRHRPARDDRQSRSDPSE